MLTERGLYNLRVRSGNSYELRRRMPIAKVGTLCSNPALDPCSALQLAPSLLACWQINHISLSRESADLFVIHHSSENGTNLIPAAAAGTDDGTFVRADFCFKASKRPEIMFHIMQLYETLTGKPLPYKYGER